MKRNLIAVGILFGRFVILIETDARGQIAK